MSKCCKYNAGMLRTVVQFQRKSRTSDGKGGFTETWGNLAGAPTRAMARAKSGAERYMSERVEATAQFMVVTRYFDGLKDSDRIVFAGKAHNIRFINNVDFDNRWLEIDVSGGVAS